jgi:hypothetical protein
MQPSLPDHAARGPRSRPTEIRWICVVSQQALETRHPGRTTTTARARHPKGRGKGERDTKETNRTDSTDAKKASNMLQRNDFHVGPPRGFEPRTYALRDCTHAWVRPYDLVPVNGFRHTECHPGTPSDREKGRPKGRASMRRFGAIWSGPKHHRCVQGGAEPATTHSCWCSTRLVVSDTRSRTPLRDCVDTDTIAALIGRLPGHEAAGQQHRPGSGSELHGGAVGEDLGHALGLAHVGGVEAQADDGVCALRLRVLHLAL